MTKQHHEYIKPWTGPGKRVMWQDVKYSSTKTILLPQGHLRGCGVSTEQDHWEAPMAGLQGSLVIGGTAPHGVGLGDWAQHCPREVHLRTRDDEFFEEVPRHQEPESVLFLRKTSLSCEKHRNSSSSEAQRDNPDDKTHIQPCFSVQMGFHVLRVWQLPMALSYHPHFLLLADVTNVDRLSSTEKAVCRTFLCSPKSFPVSLSPGACLQSFPVSWESYLISLGFLYCKV